MDAELKNANVIFLDNGDFDQNFRLTHPVCSRANCAIMFYSPMCGHCKVMKPEYAQASKSNKTGNVVYAAVDASQNQDLLMRIGQSQRNSPFSVQGVPTVVSYNTGKYFST